MKLLVDSASANQRLDTFVTSRIDGITRSKVKNEIDSGNVFVNGLVVKAGYIVKSGDEVEVNILRENHSEIKGENIPLDIVYEDNEMLVINKAQGMVVHPACGNWTKTLVNALVYKFDNLSDVNGEARAGIVHRLDKDTSGLLLVAKTDLAHLELARQIAKKECKRYYTALVVGHLPRESGVIETNLVRSPRDRRKYIVCDATKGKHAITKYRVIRKYGNYDLVEFELLTGRTHQIRVHTSHIGHPIVGDVVYGNKVQKFGTKGQLLHACRIEFTHPVTHQLMSFSIPLPDYMKNIINNL